MIKISGLSKSFHNNIIFSDLNLEIAAGEIVAIIGPSGAGKSTLLRCLNLLETPDQGSIEFDQVAYQAGTKTSRAQLTNFRQQTTMVFQQFNLFRQKTVLENVLEGLLVVKKLTRSEAEEIALEKLTLVGLVDHADYYPGQLSGGQKQRVGIARALAMNSSTLLLDEPTSALDSELVGEVLETLHQVVLQNPDQTVILISHELAFVQQVATRVLFFDQGGILEEGTPEQIFKNPQNERTRQFLSRFNQQVFS
ncbi:amino acid ABC transporter ATP-binding protein [Loigolactobacillus coryniformis subsp. coryniformis]|uniref:Amino acid ABC transporter ATP-binding protein n=1 Tax=Loigolactobacillus coryniformis subsp. torquens DSM 20004 = KCTC 3535 TaxID=1423822 RepID=A0A2D1KR68_9LACO|nr:amino acid ABC transporter ATP-binding protein [Loigolactobacillus coryniformis]ATO44638.1 amino acid ABC transporter ATP-binding protein [Loigolactobacillus coryniformis subsp. torquens DSM 20004 = KCTC 3535]